MSLSFVMRLTVSERWPVERYTVAEIRTLDRHWSDRRIDQLDAATGLATTQNLGGMCPGEPRTDDDGRILISLIAEFAMANDFFRRLKALYADAPVFVTYESWDRDERGRWRPMPDYSNLATGRCLELASLGLVELVSPVPLLTTSLLKQVCALPTP